MGNSTKKTSLFLFILRLFRMAMNVVTVTFSAKFFGVSMEKDIWVLTLTIISTIIGATWGPLNEIFRTKFIYIKEQEGTDAALDKSASIIGFIIIVSVVLSIILIIICPHLSVLMTHNMQMGASSLFVCLLLLQLPSLLINELTNIGISILNAYDVYYLPEFVGFASGIINIIAIILFANTIGIYSLLIGLYFGIITLFVVVLYYLHKKNLNLWQRVSFMKWNDVKVFILFALPFFFPYFIGQFNSLFEKYLAGIMGSGNISSIEYARQFISVLQGVLSSVLTTIMVPVLAKQYISKQDKAFEQTLKDNVMISMLIYITASVYLLGSTEPLCDFFFNRGKVPTDSLTIIVSLTRYYSFAFFGIIVYLIMGMALLASNKGKIYATIGVSTQIFVLSSNYILCPIFGVIVFPLSLGFAHLFTGMLMFRYVSLVNHKSMFFYLMKGILIYSFVIISFYVFNNIFTYNISITRLIFVTILYAIALPAVAALLGFNVKSFIIQITSKL